MKYYGHTNRIVTCFILKCKKAIQASKVEAKESPASVHIIAQGDDQ